MSDVVVAMDAELRFQMLNAGFEIFDGLPFGIGEFAVFEDFDGPGLGADDLAGDADDGGMIGDGMHHHTACADLDEVADDDVAEDLCAGADHNVIAEGGVAFPLFFAGAAESDSLVEEDIVADFGGFADDDAHAVIDEEAAANARAGVDFDAGEEAADLGEDAGEEGYSPAIELMGKAVNEDCVEAGVAQEDLEDALGGWVFPKDGIDLLPDSSKHK